MSDTRCPSLWKGVACQSIILLAAFVLVESPMRLQAQSDSGLLPPFRESCTTLDAGNRSEIGARGFDFAPGTHGGIRSLWFEDLGVNGGDTPVWPSRFGSLMNIEEVFEGKQWLGCPSSDEGDGPPASAAVTQSADRDSSTSSSKAPAALVAQQHNRPDRNLDIYYRNRREFSLDVGWHPVNIPFIYDFAVGDSYNMTPLKYTLVPIIASLRWHVTNVGWRWIFRGNMDFTFSGSITPIPRGPETHYYSFIFGIRRNFVYRNWKAVPFFEQRGGAGIINAKEPLGVIWAQGQNLTFTYNMGAGVRYNLDSKYSFSAGMNYMHISNGYLSQPAFYNYGINVYGPMFGLDIRLGKPHHSASQ